MTIREKKAVSLEVEPIDESLWPQCEALYFRAGEIARSTVFGNAKQREEVVHNAMISFMGNRETPLAKLLGMDQENIDKQLYTALRRQGQRFDYKTGRLLLLDEDEDINDFLIAAPNPADQVEARDWIDKAVESCTAHQKEVYRLQALEGYTYQEIADHLDRAKPTMKRAWSRTDEKIQDFRMNEEDM